jgi:hypothetical protein
MPKASGSPLRSCRLIVQDWDTLPALDAGKAHWPSLREAILDRIFRPAVCQQWANFHGMRHLSSSAIRQPRAFSFCPSLGRRTQLRLAGALGRAAARARRTPRCRDRAAGLPHCLVRPRSPPQPHARQQKESRKLSPLKQAVRIGGKVAPGRQTAPGTVFGAT